MASADPADGPASKLQEQATRKLAPKRQILSNHYPALIMHVLAPVISKGDLSYSGWASKTGNVATPVAKRLTAEEAERTQAMHKSASGSGSLWNAGGTFEEKNISKSAKEALTSRLVGTCCSDGNVKVRVEEVKKIDGDANIWVVRGQPRVGFDFEIDCKWSAVIDADGETQVKGTFCLPNFAVDELDDLELRDIKLEGKEEADNKAARALSLKTVKKHMLPQIQTLAAEFNAELKAKIKP